MDKATYIDTSLILDTEYNEGRKNYRVIIREEAPLVYIAALFKQTSKNTTPAFSLSFVS